MQNNTRICLEAAGAKVPIASGARTHGLDAKIPGASNEVKYILSEICVLKLPPFPNVEILSTHVCDRAIRLHPARY